MKTHSNRIKAASFGAGILLALASAASAACPVAKDLASGIALERQGDGFTSEFRQQNGKLVGTNSFVKDGKKRHVTSIYTHPLLPVIRKEANSELRSSYEKSADSLRRSLLQSQDWKSPVTVTQGEFAASGVFSVDIIEPSSLTLSGCKYPILIVETWMDLPPNDPIGMLIGYAPSLGIPIATLRLDANGEPVSGVQFDTIARIK